MQKMKVNAYKVLELAVEAGIAYGWSRAFKHNDTPSDDAIKQSVQNHVMLEICEFFDFDQNDVMIVETKADSAA